MMTREAAKNREQLEMLCLDDLVPQDHLVRKIEAAIGRSRTCMIRFRISPFK